MQQRAAQAGINLLGLVDAQRFDRAQPPDARCVAIAPRCGTILVLGTGGRAFWQAVVASGMRLPCSRDDAIADGIARRAVEDLAAWLSQRGVGCRVVLPCHGGVNFGRLAEAAGLGIVSPVSHMLLHPEFGPWLRIRGAILVDGMPFGPIEDASLTERFKPCCTCHRPCVAACPPRAHDGFGTSDRRLCAEHRHRDGCVEGCMSRAACPLGSQHRDGPSEPLHAHTVALRELQRWYGLGLWRVVPRFLRGEVR